MLVLQRKYLVILLTVFLQGFISIAAAFVFTYVPRDKMSYPGVFVAQTNIKGLVPPKHRLIVAGEGSTVYSSSDVNRIKNILLAVKALDGRLVKPNEHFSFNKTVGSRTMKKGYLNAPIISDGTLKRDTGGGVCQVATTLYQAVLDAGLQVEKRYAHSVAPDYCKVGQDATVVYGKLDFKFINSTNSPIYIKAFLLNNKVMIRLLSEKAAFKKVHIISEEKLIKSKPGQRHVSVYSVIYEKGKAIKKDLISEDDYLSDAFTKK